MSLAGKLSSLFGAAATIDPGLGGAPAGVVLPFAGASAPNGWLLCYGQAISRTTYATLFAAISTTHGVGDGSTTFNVPDMRGRVPAGKDDMGGTPAGVLNTTLTGTRGSTGTGVITSLSSTAGLAVGMKAAGTGIGTNAVISSIDSGTQVTLSVNNTATGTASIRFGVVDGATLGSIGGVHSHTLTTAQLPAHNHAVTDPGHLHSISATAGAGGNSATGGAGYGYPTAGSSASQVTGVSVQNAGSGYAHPLLQPTIVLNHIIKT